MPSQPGWPILTAGQMRWADQQTIQHHNISGEALMGAAGERVAEAVRQHAPQGSVCIVCGAGNNGGDGFAAAALLHTDGREVQIVLAARRQALRGEAASFARRAIEAGVSVLEVSDDKGLQDVPALLAGAAVVVDALFGTGLSRPLEGIACDLVDLINEAKTPVLSVDIASGIHSDRGEALGAAVRATWTLPVAAYKWGHWSGPGFDHAGLRLPPADIGIAAQIIEEAWEAVPAGYRTARVIPERLPSQIWQPREPRSHKGTYGHVWVFGGSVGFSGAPRLAARGAFAAGAGLVSIACPESVWPQIAAEEVDVMVHPDSSDAWQGCGAIVAGPGWGVAGSVRLAELIASDRVLVVDADGLNRIAADQVLAAALADRPALTVLTPHPGEAGRLLDLSTAEVQQNRKHAALELARRFDAWAVLKGAGTLVCSPEGVIDLCPFGSANMATAGTGDVLAGMIGAVLARGLEPAMAIPAAVALHGMAGESDDWFMASGLAGEVARLRRQLESRTLRE